MAKIRDLGLLRKIYNDIGKAIFEKIEDIIKTVDDQNEILDYLLIISTDITERKEGEAELEKYSKNLENVVKERMKELEEKNEEFERFNQLFIGREFRIKELKEKVKKLESKISGNI